MKTQEEIIQRINELKKDRPLDDYEISYLAMALEKDKWELCKLLHRYKFELRDAQAIVNALSWVLEDEEEAVESMPQS